MSQGAGKNGNVPPAEHRWKPGQSGNPKGRPKGRLTGRLSRLLRQYELDGASIPQGQRVADALVIEWIKKALDGSYYHLKEILERIEGKVADRLETLDVTALTDAELEEIARGKGAR